MTENAALKTYGMFAAHRNEKLINRLQSEKCNLILFPESELTAAELTAGELRIISEIDKFDWLIFFEPESVDFFLAALNAVGIDLFELDNLRICALGELTADRLRFEQLHTDIIFSLIQNKVVDLIAEYIGNERELKNRKILVVKEKGAEILIERQLIEKQMIGEILEIFKSELKDGNQAKYKALLKGGAIDEIILTSPHDLISLKKIYAPIENIRNNDFQIAANGENLAMFLRDNGLTAKIFK